LKVTGTRTGIDGSLSKKFGNIGDERETCCTSSRRLRSDALGKRDERDDDSSVISFQIQVIFVLPTPSVHRYCSASGFGLGSDIVLSLETQPTLAQKTTTKYSYVGKFAGFSCRSFLYTIYMDGST
jgi:hypothetical protein